MSDSHASENLRAFSYAHDTDVELFGSVFGIASIEVRSSIYTTTAHGLTHAQLKTDGTPISGTGSVARSVTGRYKGTLNYNDIEDLTGKKYQLICQREGGNLRIDFFARPETHARIIFFAPFAGSKLEFSGIFQFN